MTDLQKFSGKGNIIKTVSCPKNAKLPYSEASREDQNSRRKERYELNGTTLLNCVMYIEQSIYKH